MRALLVDLLTQCVAFVRWVRTAWVIRHEVYVQQRWLEEQRRAREWE